MPALSAPSTSSVSSSTGYPVAAKSNYYASSDKAKSNRSNNRPMIAANYSGIESSTSNISNYNDNVLRVDTRHNSMINIQGNRRPVQQTSTLSQSTTSTTVTRPTKGKELVAPSTPIVESPAEIQRKLKENLSRFTINGDRRMVGRTLNNCKILKQITFDRSSILPVPVPSLDQLEKMACVTPVEFNGTLLGGGKFENNPGGSGNSISSGSNGTPSIPKGWNDVTEIPAVLKEVCSRLARHPELEQPNERELYEAVMVRFAKLQSSQDSNVQLASYLACPPDLNVYEPKKPWKPLGRTQVWLYVSDGHAHIQSKSCHAFGLFRKSDTINRPWIGLTATVNERMNLTTGASFNRISVEVHEDKYSL